MRACVCVLLHINVRIINFNFVLLRLLFAPATLSSSNPPALARLIDCILNVFLLLPLLALRATQTNKY